VVTKLFSLCLFSMKGMYDRYLDWLLHNDLLVMARVIQTWGSSPRGVGSIMLVNAAGNMLGSVSGGCVEGDVVKKSMELIKTGGRTILSYGVSDADAWSVGLACGGKVTLLLQCIRTSETTVWSDWMNYLALNKPCILISSTVEGEKSDHIMLADMIDEMFDFSLEMKVKIKKVYKERHHCWVKDATRSYFIHLFPGKFSLIMTGAVHISNYLNTLAQQFDFETILIEPREFFTKHTHFDFPPDKIFQSYMSEIQTDLSLDHYTFCALLSHDPKIDDDALEILLRSDVAYIGALGSRSTHEKRKQRLMEKGFSVDQIEKIYAPIGLNIASHSANEIALAILAEIIQVKNSAKINK
jgi:xanthine dehydrogenase accessory factor